MRLSVKITALVFLLATLFVVSSISLNHFLLRTYLSDAQSEWVNTLTHAVAEGISRDAINGNALHARDQLKAIVELDKALEYAYLTGFDGKLFVHTFDNGFPRALLQHIKQEHDRSHIDFQFETQNGALEDIGIPLIAGMRARLHVGINQNEISNLIERTKADIFWTSLMIALLGTGLAILTGRRISAPLAELSAWMNAYGKGERQGVFISKSTTPEVTDLAASFNEMIAGRATLAAELHESEAFNRMLVDSSPIGFALARMDGSLVDVNPAYADILGRTSEDIQQLNYRDLTPDEYAEDEQKQLHSLNTTGQYGPYEKEYIHADGHRVSVRLHGRLVKRNGEDLIWSSVEDITIRKLAERDMSLFKATLDETLDCVFMFTPDTLRFFYVNQGAMNQVGYDHDEMMNMSPFDIKPHISEEQFRELITPMIKGDRETLQFETVHESKDGHKIPVEIFLQYINLPGEEPRFVALVRDITERKQIEKVLQKSNEELEERVQLRTEEFQKATKEAEQANMAKSDFLSSMSHELRTPLNAILGFSQLLAMDLEDPAHKDQVDEVYRAGLHLLELINQILDLSRIEAGKLEFSIESVDLKHVFVECFSLIAPQALKHNIKIIDNTSIDTPHMIEADYTRLKQVMLNLLSNAVKYNRDGGSVAIDCKVVGEKQLRISVTDTGHGLNEAEKKRIFKPFDRIGRETSGIEGTGIGLVITRHLMELMGGKVGFESSVGQGSIFWVDVNLSEDDVQKIPVSADLVQETKSLAKHDDTFTATILYVEDNVANLKVVENLIKTKTSCKLLTAPNALIGIGLAERHHPDLILMDINLPGMDGYEALEILQTTKTTSDIPVIAVSANAMKSDIDRGRAAGFKIYLTKPFDIKEFLKVIETTVEKSGIESDTKAG